MRKVKAVIVGSGVSGLSAAWYLAKKIPKEDALIVEQHSALGGCIQTDVEEGMLIERGPRIFKTAKNRAFLTLIQELDYQKELISSCKKAKGRYIYTENRLQKALSTGGASLFFALAQEWRKKRGATDESIWDFSCRRLGQAVTERIIDPMTLGIYAGDIRKLSILSCFPTLKRWEQEKGSLTKGILCHLFSPKGEKNGSSLFSFQKGVFSFMENLASQIPFPIEYEQGVLTIQKKGDALLVVTEKEVIQAENVILAVPATSAASMLSLLSPTASFLLARICYNLVTSVCVAWEKSVFPCTGIGYLVPSKEKSPILGCLFDSHLFPQQDAHVGSKMTMMLRGSFTKKEDIEKIALEATKKHLKLSIAPSHISYKMDHKQMIPQYFVGHSDLVSSIRSNLPPGIVLTGNYLEGVSVSDCIALSRKEMEQFEK
jgi:protoporphyrinogen/coproporphyrinogen III oxidase